MVCPTCGLDNDPDAARCARCNSTLAHAATTYYAPPPPPEPSRPNRVPLIAGASVLLVVLAVAAGIYFRTNGTDDPGPQPTEALPTRTEATTDPVPAPTTTEPTVDPTTPATTAAADPRAQAAAFDAVLSQSVASRRKLNLAIEQVGQCDGLAAAVADIRAVGDERQSQMETVRNADVSALSGGEELRAGLLEALRYAWEADQGFLAWAEPTLSGGCGAADDSGYDRGRSASTSAGAAKRAFLTRWNPVAKANGLRARSADDI
ncbi:hypothetical protein [Actinoplanes subglobosus]|uniref:Zinc ribbon domain-containing protein n=1 Tax=Actinoplanes subglobosus TaxID=1547892 RepID=A0ABV8JB03_9ACTN